ncbi:MAG: NADH-quinone oxidoreductase subunit NuoE [Anaerohalosphaeraceae bacterium]|jgi:NADH:ubiquinone oxidoreductase subunit E
MIERKEMITADEQKLKDLKDFIAPLKGQPYVESQLIAVLHKVQEFYGYLPKDVLDMVADAMNIPTAHIWGVATFYHYFNLNPPGRYTISVCLGTACYVKGAGQILETLRQHLGIDEGQVTADGLFSIAPARCVGACGLAPVMMIDEKIYGELTPEKTIAVIEEYRKKAQDEG